MTISLGESINYVKDPMAQRAIHRVFTALDVEIDALRTLVNATKTQILGSTGLLITPALAIGTTKDQVANGAFSFTVSGVSYAKAATAAGTAPAAEVIPEGKYGLWRFEIGVNGTIDVAGAAGNEVGYATEALAIAACPATSTGHCLLGYVTVTKSVGDFTGATTNFDATNVTAAYYSAALAIVDTVTESLGA